MGAAAKAGHEHLQKYLDYISNTGGSPTTDQFDEDWEPIGPLVRQDLLNAGLITIEGGNIYLTNKGGL